MVNTVTDKKKAEHLRECWFCRHTTDATRANLYRPIWYGSWAMGLLLMPVYALVWMVQIGWSIGDHYFGKMNHAFHEERMSEEEKAEAEKVRQQQQQFGVLFHGIGTPRPDVDEYEDDDDNGVKH